MLDLDGARVGRPNDLGQHALLVHLQAHHSLVRLDVADRVTRLHLLTLTLQKP